MSLYLDIIIRSTSVYLFLVIAIRLFGRKELSQLSTADLVFIILISNAVQNAMIGPDTSLQGGLLAALVLFVLNYFMKLIMFRSRAFKNLVENKPVILIHDGKIDLKSLFSLQITQDELDEAIREHGLANYTEVKLAMMEVDGNISVISKDGAHLKQTHFKRRRKQKTLNQSA